jgi:hypothetical protein
MAVREAELERERTELERLRRAELNEIRDSTAEMVPELKSTLATNMSQKIKNLRLVPDYEHMARTAELYAKLEEQNERIYQEQLAKWFEELAEMQRADAHFASWRKPCRFHGEKSCDCPKEPGCDKVPPRSPVREGPRAPVKAAPPKMPVKYKMEFDVEQDVESQAITEAQPSRAPVKEMCLPKEGKSCGKGDCDKCRHLFHNRHSGSYEDHTDGEQPVTNAVPPPTPPVPVLFDGETVYRSVYPDERVANAFRTP